MSTDREIDYGNAVHTPNGILFSCEICTKTDDLKSILRQPKLRINTSPSYAAPILQRAHASGDECGYSLKFRQEIKGGRHRAMSKNKPHLNHGHGCESKHFT